MARTPFLTTQTEAAIVLTLFDLANHLHRGGEKLAATAQLTTQQWLVLLQIAGDPNFPATRPGMLASDIAEARGVTRATISVVIRALRRRGLVTERVDRDDARRRRLAATAAGIAVLEEIQPTRHAANERLFAELDARERARLLAGLRSCLSVLWELQEDARTRAARARLDARSASRQQSSSSRPPVRLSARSPSRRRTRSSRLR